MLSDKAIKLYKLSTSKFGEDACNFFIVWPDLGHPDLLPSSPSKQRKNQTKKCEDFHEGSLHYVLQVQAW
jgi:hypothetical protein